MARRFVQALTLSTCLTGLGMIHGTAHAAATNAATVPSDVISGVVTSAKGPEAGVWVIAETNDLPTRFIKIVVTDDQGRYLLPELPANVKYDVWVRGYGLVDSKHVIATGGQRLNLAAVIAPSPKAAAEYYPANYWYAMINPPPDSEFPGTGAKGNGIPTTIKTKQHWFAQMREECGHCHQVGNKITRELADNSLEGWAERINKARPAGDQAIGNRGTTAAAGMKNVFTGLGYQRSLGMMADWTKRIAAGELPEVPPRPVGIERNAVITLWDWGNGRFLHDTSATDRRDPSRNGYGPVYSSGVFTGAFELIDLKTHTPKEIGYGVATDTAGRFANMSDQHDINQGPHNTMLDSKNRVWASDSGRSVTTPIARPAYCTDPNNPYAKYFPKPGRSAATAVIFDPKEAGLTGVSLCYSVHHLAFARDKDETLFFTGPGGDAVGWIKTKVWDETKDAEKAQGWCPMVLDTKRVALNGPIKITPDRAKWNKPPSMTGSAESEVNRQGTADANDPDRDTQIGGGQYGLDMNPVDDSTWYAQNSVYPSAILRFERGSNPPETCITEKYEPPMLPGGVDYLATGGRGVSMDTKGIAWDMFASGKMGRFDRSKCKVLRGPTATGQHCPEGWSFIEFPGPRLKNSGGLQADWNYLTWVDQYNTLGMGADVVLTPGTWSDSMKAVVPETGKVYTLHIPYPQGAYARGLDGRIDDAKAGWKGRGLWTTYGMYTVWHQEGGEEGMGPELVHIQFRPDPLAN